MREAVKLDAHHIEAARSQVHAIKLARSKSS